MTEERTHKSEFLDSLDRCAADEAFMDSFYERFLNSSIEIKAKFIGINFEDQHKMLLRSLKLSAGATAGEPEALQEIRERGETHSRHQLNIQPIHYKYWLESVVETASEYDPEWSSSVENSWRTILQFVIDHMVRMY